MMSMVAWIRVEAVKMVINGQLIRSFGIQPTTLGYELDFECEGKIVFKDVS